MCHEYNTVTGPHCGGNWIIEQFVTYILTPLLLRKVEALFVDCNSCMLFILFFTVLKLMTFKIKEIGSEIPASLIVT